MKMKNEMLARLWRHMSENKYIEKERFKEHGGRDNIWASKKTLTWKVQREWDWAFPTEKI